MNKKLKIQDVLRVFKISKQADFKSRKQHERSIEYVQMTIDLCTKLRKEHPVMGCKKIFMQYGSTLPFGRDKFISISKAHGLTIRPKRNPKITTIAIKNQFVPNKIEGMKLTGINQLWQSDIFYYQHQGKHKYVFIIIDVFSRRILAAKEAESLHAKHLVSALKIATKKRNGQDLTGCIFHSDRGTQYFSDQLKDCLKKYGINRSMALRAQQNAYAERVQGTIQHEYLDHMNHQKPLSTLLEIAVDLYNNSRPHQELDYKSPIQFEKEINNQPIDKRPEMTIYQWVEKEFTILPLPNKKEKRSKKEKSTTLVHL